MRSLLVPGLLLLLPVLASATPPSDAQLDRLLEVTRIEQELARMIPHVEASQAQMAKRFLGEGADTDRAAQAALAQSQAAIRRSLSWERLRPLYLDIYRNTYEGEDIEAIIQFYQSPAGQRLLERQPALIQNTMQAVQQLIEPEFAQLSQALSELEHVPTGKKGRP